MMKSPINSKRSNIQIIGEILGLGETGKTRMMYSANMSHGQMERYLDYLLSEGFMEPVNYSKYGIEKGRTFYRPTEEGKNLLNMIQSMGDVLG